MSLFKKLLADSENSTIPWNLSGDKKIWRLIMFCLTCCRFSCLVMKSLSLENGSSSCYPHNLLIFFGPRLPNHSILTAPCIDIFISLLFKTLSVYIQMMMIFVTIDSDLPLSHKKISIFIIKPWQYYWFSKFYLVNEATSDNISTCRISSLTAPSKWTK